MRTFFITTNDDKELLLEALECLKQRCFANITRMDKEGAKDHDIQIPCKKMIKINEYMLELENSILEG